MTHQRALRWGRIQSMIDSLASPRSIEWTGGSDDFGIDGFSRTGERSFHPVQGPAWSRLQLCAELKKPDSLCIRSMGTPKNHRSPPA